MPGIACNVGPRVFKTKAEREEYIKNRIRQLADAYTHVSDGEAFQFLCHVLEQHPCYESLVGRGVQAFRLEKTWDGKGVHATLVRTDGSETPFSWNKCGTGRKDTKTGMLSAAMREAVAADMMEFKNATALKDGLRCALCQTEDAESYETDHVCPPFCRIRDRFLEESRLPTPTSFGRSTQFARSGHAFKPQDAMFHNAWLAFHREHARLQVLCVGCNREKRDKDV